jgi:hypothetical protein
VSLKINRKCDYRLILVVYANHRCYFFGQECDPIYTLDFLMPYKRIIRFEVVADSPSFLNVPSVLQKMLKIVEKMCDMSLYDLQILFNKIKLLLWRS